MRQRWGCFGTIVLGYGALALLATWPLAWHFNTHAPGSDWWGSYRLFFETPTNLWNLWWFRHALTKLHQSPFLCGYIFYPHGANLWFHTFAPVHGLLGFFLQSALSLAATQNVLLLMNLVASGGCTYLLARHLGVSGAGAFVAGAVYAFSPGVFAHLYVGHFELLSTFWMPAGLLLFLRLTDAPSPRWREGMLLGLILVGTAYLSHYYVIYSGELILLAAILRWRKTTQRVVLKTVGVAAIVALLGISPIVWAFLGPDAPEVIRPTTSDFDWFSGDLASFLVPSFSHPFLAGSLKALHERVHVIQVDPAKHLFVVAPQEKTLFLGLSVLGLALYAAVQRGRLGISVKLPIAIALVFGILSLGSHLKVLGAATGLPLPAGLLEELPLVRLARAPGRHIVPMMLGMGVLAGMGWQGIRRGAVRWAVLGLIALEYTAVPLPLFSAQVPEVYHRLARAPGRFAVLEIPFGLRDGLAVLGRPDSAQMFAQTVHGHPIVTGFVARLPLRSWQAVVGSPIIGALLNPSGVTAQQLREDLATGPAYFARWHIQAILIHPQAKGKFEQQYLERVLPIRSREDFADGSQLLWLEIPP